jgi:hypothetical protein
LEPGNFHEYKDVLISGVNYDFSRNRHENIPPRLYADWAALMGKLANVVFPLFVVPPFPKSPLFQTESIPSDGPYSANADYYMLDYVYFELKGENGCGLKISFENGRLGGDNSVMMETLGFHPGVASYIDKEAATPRASFSIRHRNDQTLQIKEIIARHQEACLGGGIQTPTPDETRKVEKCSLCGDLPNDFTVNTGRDDYDLNPTYQLTCRLISTQNADFYRCPTCGTYFYWIDMPQFYGSGNNAEERFIRYPLEANPLLEIFFSPETTDQPQLGDIEEYFKTIHPEILWEMLQSLVRSAPQVFALFIPHLCRLLITKNSSAIQNILRDYISDQPERAEAVLNVFRSLLKVGGFSPISETFLYCFSVVQKKNKF